MPGPKGKMCTMGFIYDKWNIMRVHGLCDRTDVRNYTIVGRRYDQNPTDLRVLPQLLFHILRGNPTLYPQMTDNLWINIFRLQRIEDKSMIHRFMAIAAHQNRLTGMHHRPDGT